MAGYLWFGYQVTVTCPPLSQYINNQLKVLKRITLSPKKPKGSLIGEGKQPPQLIVSPLNCKNGIGVGVKPVPNDSSKVTKLDPRFVVGGHLTSLTIPKRSRELTHQVGIQS